jgi:hypothetical protein
MTVGTSTIGFGIFLGSSLIYWTAKKQFMVARSSIKTGYRAMVVASTDIYIYFYSNSLV